ncbi:MAG: hypothetical protein J6I49_09245 [Bacteroidales bacterium]|nr:hypothetical protein [Bacteroidales bacterium]
MAALLFAVAVVLCGKALQTEGIYRKVSSVVRTYEKVTKDDGSWYTKKVKKPFTRPADGDMLSWDAAIYDLIRQHGYDSDHVWGGYFAFFPLFPLVWRLTRLGPIGVSVFNWFLFSLGLLLLALLFADRRPRWAPLLPLCAPYAVIFMIPYSEALFFISIALGMYGLVKERYWLYFVGFLLGSMTRAAGNIMIVAWLVVDVVALISSRGGWKQFVLDVARHLAPIVLGVFAVMVVQRFYGAEHWFEYAASQRYWGKYLSLPEWPLTDWTEMGRSVTWPLLLILTVPSLVWLALSPWRGIGKGPMAQLRMLSVLFFVGNVLLAFITQHGCLYSQARLLTCTPFFVFLLYDMATVERGRAWQWGMAVAMIVTAVLCIDLFSYPRTRGCWLVFTLALLTFFGRQMKTWVAVTLLSIAILFNVYWTTYLYNDFLLGAWVYT